MLQVRDDQPAAAATKAVGQSPILVLSSAQRGVLGRLEIERVHLRSECAVAFGLSLDFKPFRVGPERRPSPLGVVSVLERQQVDEEVFASISPGSVFEERHDLEAESGEDAKGVIAKARPQRLELPRRDVVRPQLEEAASWSS